MEDLKQKFAIAAITASVAFNTMANDVEAAPEANPDSPNITEIMEELGYAEGEGLTEEELNFEMPSIEHDDLIEQLNNISDSSDASNFLSHVTSNSTYSDLYKQAGNGAEALDQFLTDTQTSPYVAIPLLIGIHREDVLTMKYIEVLERHGMDMKLADDFVMARSNGSNHLHDLIEDEIRDSLSDPKIMIQASQNGDAEYSNLPTALKERIDSNMSAYNYLRSSVTGEESQTVTADIAPLNEEYNFTLTPEMFQKALYEVIDYSYEAPLLNRERGYMDIQQQIEAKYDGVTFEGGIQYEYAQGLNLPEQNTDFTLVVVEPSDDDHSDVTHRYAEGLATQISPDGEGAHDVVFLGTDDDFDETFTGLQVAAYSNNSVILSKSYGYAPSEFFVTDGYTAEADIEHMLNYSFHENNQTIQFIAVGNSYTGHSTAWSDDRDEVVDSQIQAASLAIPEAHAQRSVVIGAAHIQGDTNYMSSYTSVGAEFLMETPDFYDAGAKGTSFSTPTAAAYYHQIAESYADVLTHEEIMMAALYSTETNVHNVTLENAISIDEKEYESDDYSYDPDTMDYEDTVYENEKQFGEEQIQNFEMTIFRTNAAGVPFNERAGAGLLNVHKWQENLDQLKAIKSTFEHDSDYITQKMQIKGTEEAPDEDSMFNHKYTVTIDADMTLDKQTLYLDQVGLNNVRVTTPSGMKSDFLGTMSGYVSTRGFAGEDLQAGDEIIIETSLPLGEHTEFTLRGFEDGNPVQAFREHKIAEGQTLQASTVYEGDEIYAPYTQNDTQIGTYAENAQYKMAALIQNEEPAAEESSQGFKPPLPN